MLDKNEYQRKWQRENKEKVAGYNKKYRETHKEKVKEIAKNWRLKNIDRVKEINKRSHIKFKETHNWSEYCDERRKARAERLMAQGIKNPWAVMNGGKPKYKEKENE